MNVERYIDLVILNIEYDENKVAYFFYKSLIVCYNY